jgi:hypothetical protein
VDVLFEQGSAKFANFTKALSINLVECSPTLQKIQYNTLKCEDDHVGDDKRTVSKICGAPVCWHASLEQVPSGCMRLFSFLSSNWFFHLQPFGFELMISTEVDIIRNTCVIDFYTTIHLNVYWAKISRQFS